MTDAAILPSFSGDQDSSSLTVSLTLNPWFLKNSEFSVASSPPLAAISPAYPAYLLISIGTVLSLNWNAAGGDSFGTSTFTSWTSGAAPSAPASLAAPGAPLLWPPPMRLRTM